MRKFYVFLTVLVLLASLTACSKGPEYTQGLNNAAVGGGLPLNTVFEYSKKLGDEALAYYLGREYDKAYSSLFVDIDVLTPDNKLIYLEDKAATHVLYFLQTAVKYSTTLPGSPFYSEEEDPTIDVSVVSMLDRTVFKDGTAPNIVPMDVDMRITPEFTRWFIDKAKAAGILDNRLNFELGDTVTLSVNSTDCDASKGGLSFKVFDETYTIDAYSVGITPEELRTSPIYNMVVKSYKFYDTGLYKVTYVTDPNAGVSTKREITISFRYRNPDTQDNFSSELSRFVAGVTNLSIKMSK